MFRAYFLYKQLLDGAFGIVSLPDMTPPDPLAELKAQMAVVSDSVALQAHALLPFGQDGNDGGPICFKTNEPTPAGDYPIYFTDHELLIFDPEYSGERRWNSFGHLLEDIQANMLSYG